LFVTQIVPGLCKVLQSDRMWMDMTTVLRAVYPALLLLCLADQKKPGMDKLYYYVRRMDETMKKSKELLDNMEINYTGSTGALKYFLQSSTIDCNTYINELNKATFDRGGDSDDDSTTSVEDGAMEEVSDDEDNIADIDISLLETTTLGTKVVDRWEHRKKKLVTDLANTGWMLSPSSEVMEDCFINHDGSHRNALEQILKKWILVKVKCNVDYYISC
jgi:hypothetical protein